MFRFLIIVIDVEPFSNCFSLDFAIYDTGCADEYAVRVFWLVYVVIWTHCVDCYVEPGA